MRSLRISSASIVASAATRRRATAARSGKPCRPANPIVPQIASSGRDSGATSIEMNPLVPGRLDHTQPGARTATLSAGYDARRPLIVTSCEPPDVTQMPSPVESRAGNTRLAGSATAISTVPPSASGDRREHVARAVS
jgi:hypothetical protein